MMAMLGRLACVWLLVASTTGSTVAAATPGGYKRLVFSEEFSGPLDVSPDGGGQHKWYNGLWYRPQAGEFVVSDGYLRATTDLTPLRATSMAFLTTWPRSGNARPTLFRFGYFEARMRFQPGHFNWPAFWLLSQDRTRHDGKGGRGEWCEIDIFEGGQPHLYQGTVHHWNDNRDSDNANQHMPLPEGADLTKWNTFGALWQPGRISWYFNGQLLGSAPSPKVCDEQQLFLIIGAQKRKYGPLPTYLDVDWVRVYG